MALLRPVCGRLSTVIVLSLLLAVRTSATTLQVGASLPDASLPDAQGRTVALTSLHAPVVIVEFWASWCGVCREALPAFSALAGTYAPHAQLVAINIDRDAHAAQQWIERNLQHSSATVLFDPDNHVMTKWGAPGMPSVFVAVNGVIRLVHTGYDAEAYEAVHRVLQEALPTPAAAPR